MKPEQAAIGDLICAILETIYVKNRSRMRREASQRSLTVEQLAAAAIAEAVREQYEAAGSL